MLKGAAAQRESKKGERAHCADPTGSDLGVAAF